MHFKLLELIVVRREVDRPPYIYGIDEIYVNI